MQEPQVPPWNDPHWLDEARAWIDAALPPLGLVRNGEIEQPHVRPWSTVLRIPTSGGDLYFKAVEPLLRHEVPVTQAISAWHPDCSLPLLAVDVARGWMLQPDGGQRLREALKELGSLEAALQRWERLLPRYADLQRDLSKRRAKLLALGAPDRQLAALPGLFAGLLEAGEFLYIDQPQGLSGTDLERLRASAPRLAECCTELASCGIPESIHHGDFHDGNIFVRGSDLDCYAIFDWGDCSIAHPFFSLRTAFVSLENSLGLPEDAPELECLVGSYLEAWSDLAVPERLWRAYYLSRPLSSLCSALGWQRSISSLPLEQRREYAEAVPGLLLECLQYLDQL